MQIDALIIVSVEILINLLVDLSVDSVDLVLADSADLVDLVEDSEDSVTNQIAISQIVDNQILTNQIVISQTVDNQTVTSQIVDNQIAEQADSQIVLIANSLFINHLPVL